MTIQRASAISCFRAMLAGEAHSTPAAGVAVMFHLHYEQYSCCSFPPPPGGEMQVPFGILSSMPAEGFSVAVGFSAEALEAVEAERVWERADGRPFDFFAFEMRNVVSSPGQGPHDGGSIAVLAILSSGESVLPANVENLVLRLRFRVRADSPPAGGQLLDFLEAAPGPDGELVRNGVLAGGEPIIPETSESFVFISGYRICICPNTAFFIRADANADLRTDVSDAVRTLGFLFADDPAPPCADAADANDDGWVDLSDPIATLNYLFLGGDAPPAPFPHAGLDETADGLVCRVH